MNLKLKRAFCALAACLLAVTVMPALPNTINAATAATTKTGVWDGTAATSFAGGSGTEGDPYLISNGAELAYLREIVNNAVVDTYGMCFALTNDVYLNDVSDYTSWDKEHPPANVWIPIGYNTYEITGELDVIVKHENAFKGKFDGRGHTVHGVYVNTLRDPNDGFAPFQEGSGLFGSAHYALFCNLNLSSSFIASETVSVGGIVGWLYKGGDALDEDYAIKNCRVESSCRISGRQNVGGMVGLANSFQKGIYNCVNEGSISGCNGVGGISGGAPQQTAATLVISGCLNRGNIIASPGGIEDAYSAGGIVGWIVGNIEKCANHGDVSSRRVAGGIVGDPDENALISDCYNAGSINADFEAGGICGVALPHNVFARCYNVGNVSANYSVGGLVGYVHPPVTFNNCYYLENCCQNPDTYYGAPRSTAQLQAQSGYEGFDFANVWIMEGDESYPYAQLRAIEYSQQQPASGDVDGDGSVTIADAIITLRCAMSLLDGAGFNMENADMDGNGSINVADAILILRIAMGF